jgi:hypothetical protein
MAIVQDRGVPDGIPFGLKPSRIDKIMNGNLGQEAVSSQQKGELC